jgi:hypothetical protein
VGFNIHKNYDLITEPMNNVEMFIYVICFIVTSVPIVSFVSMRLAFIVVLCGILGFTLTFFPKELKKLFAMLP